MLISLYVEESDLAVASLGKNLLEFKKFGGHLLHGILKRRIKIIVRVRFGFYENKP